jgi:hypothetical protein
MSPSLQTAVALAIAAVAVAWLAARALSRRRRDGCGGDCGCPSSELKGKIARNGGDKGPNLRV